jgi:serine O-acetyltransferase
MLTDLRGDLRRAAHYQTTYQAADPSWPEMARAVVEKIEVWAIVEYRLRQAADRSPLAAFLKPVTWITRHVIELLTGICLPTRAKIGPGFAINHHGPIIVHGDFKAGENLTLSHQTTVGALHDGVPTAGDCVFIGPGARVLGAVELGDRAMIGANAVVTSDVSADHVAVGVPARARPDPRPVWLSGAARPS